MVKVIAIFELRDGAAAKAIVSAKELVEKTRAEKGCIQYDLLQSEAKSDKLVILETWATQADLDAHSASEHFTRIVPMLAGLCTASPVVERFIQLS